MGRLLETLTIDRFGHDPKGRSNAWTSRYYLKENDGPPRVTLSVHPQDPGSLVSGKVLAYLDVDRTPSESQAPFYSSRNPDQPIQQALFCGGATPCCKGPTPCQPAIGSEGRQFGANVAFIIIHSDSRFDGPSVRTCTGLAIPPYYVLTNWHCGYEGQTNWDAGVCLRTFVDLSFDDDNVSRDQQCQKFIHASRDLDLALLQINSVAGPTPIPPVTFLAADCETDALGERRCPARNNIAAMTENEGLFVVHHSRGKDKQISFVGASVKVVQNSRRKTGPFGARGYG